MAAGADGAGYRLVASDRGISNFGSAGFLGSRPTGGLHLNSPVVVTAASP